MNPKADCVSFMLHGAKRTGSLRRGASPVSRLLALQSHKEILGKHRGTFLAYDRRSAVYRDISLNCKLRRPDDNA